MVDFVLHDGTVVENTVVENRTAATDGAWMRQFHVFHYDLLHDHLSVHLARHDRRCVLCMLDYH